MLMSFKWLSLSNGLLDHLGSRLNRYRYTIIRKTIENVTITNEFDTHNSDIQYKVYRLHVLPRIL